MRSSATRTRKREPLVKPRVAALFDHDFATLGGLVPKSCLTPRYVPEGRGTRAWGPQTQTFAFGDPGGTRDNAGPVPPMRLRVPLSYEHTEFIPAFGAGAASQPLPRRARRAE